MFSSFVYFKVTGTSMWDLAVKRADPPARDQRRFDGCKPLDSFMTLSTWEKHKTSIIADIVIGVLAVGTCAGVAIAFHGGTPMIWIITGSSLAVTAVGIDIAGCKLNIIRLSNKISDHVVTRTEARRKTLNDRL